MLSKYQKDPFRLFFPLGFILGTIGILPWVFVLNHPIYPVDFHRTMMIGGFLTAFVTGFLMTAIPRFTMSAIVQPRELLVSFFAILIACLFSGLGLLGFFYLFILIAHLNLVWFLVQRFLSKNTNPPPTFLFIGLGFIVWVISDVVLMTLSFYPMGDGRLFNLFRNLWEEGAILSLVLGVGGKLISGILGWETIEPQCEDTEETLKKFFDQIPTLVYTMVPVYLVSFFVESYIDQQLGFLLRSFVVLYFAIRFWKIYRFPKIKTHLTWNIWFVGWLFVIGFFLRALWVSGGIHGAHIIFIGGFTTLTLMIATRVALAHSHLSSQLNGHLDLVLEKKSWVISIVAFLMAFAALTRVIAILIPKAYMTHLAYAAIVWILAVMIWLIRFFKILK